MANPYYPPDSRLNSPELYYPKRKPVGKVKIDWSHPLSKGLEYVDVQQTLGGSFTDSGLVSNIGDSKVFNGSSFSTLDDVDIGRYSKGTVTISHSSTVLPPNGPTYSHMLFSSTGVNSSVDSKGLIMMLGNGTGYLQCRLYTPTSSASQRSADSTVALNDGIRHVSTSVWKGDTNGYIKAYVDGTEVASDTTITSSPTEFTHGALIGASEDPFWGKFEGTVQFVFIHSRALSDQEIKSLHDDPYQFLIPDRS